MDHSADDLFQSFREISQRSSRKKGGRKTLQLCRQVQRALGYALGECRDDRLHELYVESVVPAPHERRLLVTVSPLGEPLPAADILRLLQAAQPFLRQQVAEAIHRKRVPELVFQYRPASPAETGTETGTEERPGQAR